MLPPKDFLLINKPIGWTSFDVVGYIRGRARKATKIKNIKVGHAGTLDPFATGLLIVGVGRDATKRLDEFKNLPKTYTATIFLGAISDTDDVTGTIANNEIPRDSEIIDEQAVRAVLRSFIGKQEQIPPMYSAKKIDGQRLYKLARQGKVIERRPTAIEIYDIKLLNYAWPKLEIEVACSAGTYIRTLARDIGEKLGVGGYCEALCRTKIGPYALSDAKSVEDITF